MSGGSIVARTLTGRPVVAGSAEGVAVVSRQPLSFWGGLSSRTGEIIDRRHERSGTIVTGKVFVFPQGKGSSTGSAVLMEGIKVGTAPAAIVNVKVDPILALGAIVADELYHKTVPVVVLSQEDFDTIQEGDHLTINPDGTIEVRAL
jgi:predicted aconitase with swiveling domain